jgi:V-type H+-transporting ATPase subunit a
MSIFRSEEMKHLSIRIPKDSASEIMRVLGNLDYSIEFVDLTKDDIEAKKNYGQLIHRCDEVLKKIQDFNNISSDFGQTQNKYDKYLDFKNDIEKDIKNRDKKSGSYYFDLVENEIFENDKRIKELVESHTNIREDLLNLIEKKYVFSKTRDLIINNEINPNIANNENLNENFIQTINNLNFMAGTINIGDELKMKRMIFRVSRGRALTTFYDFEMNKNEYLYCLPIKNRGMKIEENNIFSNNMFDYGSVIKKKIFNIMFPGGEENILLNKILKVCEIFQL